MKQRPNSILTRSLPRWLAGALLAAACMLLTFLLYKVTFLNNDDTNIFYALAGYRTGRVYFAHRFINAALGAVISGLYRALPAVPWWAVYQLAMLWLSLTVINACLLKRAGLAGMPAWAALTGCCLLYATVFVYAVAWVTFTLTACLLGTAAAALMLSFDWERDTPAMKRGAAAGALLLLAQCFLTRNSAGYSMLCFVAAALFYQAICSKGKRLLAVLCYGAAALALCGGLVLLNNVGIRKLNPAGYAEFERARGRFIDYPHVTYGEDPAFFEEMGWDRTVYDLADNLCYLDERVNADAMNRVANAPYGRQRSLAGRLWDTLQYGITYFRGSGASQYMLVAPVLLLFGCIACYLRGRRGGRALLTACCTGAGAFGLCFYLCYTGRFPVRTFMLVCMPAALLPALLLVRLVGENRGAQTKERSRWKRALAVALALACVCGLGWSVGMTQRTLLRYDESQRIAQNAAGEAYAIAHPDNVYITDVTSLVNLALFTVYPEADKRPVNLIDWGGTGMHSGWKAEQLAANGVSDFTGALFARENVYFLTEKEGDKLGILYAYLQKHFGATGYTQVDTVCGDIAVYRFAFFKEAAE